MSAEWVRLARGLYATFADQRISDNIAFGREVLAEPRSDTMTVAIAIELAVARAEQHRRAGA